MGKNKSYAWIWIILSILLLAGVVVYGGMNGWFAFVVNISNNFPSSISEIPSEVVDHNLYLSLSVVPKNICVGDSTTGSLSSNMAKAYCRIFVDTGSGYKKLMDVQLDNSGSYSTTQQINSAGAAKFRAACILDGKYAISNEDVLVASFCASPNPDQSSSNPYANYPCGSIPTPTSAGMCAEGVCDDFKVCKYYVATITTPARCGCAIR